MRIIVCLTTAVAALALAGQAPAAVQMTLAQKVQKALDIAEVQNVMSRYSDDNWDEDFEDLLGYIALDEPDVHVNTPNSMVGAQKIRDFYMARVNKRKAGTTPPGQLHLHPNMTPIIEVAGDGKTAKAVFDSLGPDIGSGSEVGNWVFTRYGVDFIKKADGWKIWHLQTFSVANTSYDKSFTQTAKDRREGKAPAMPGVPPTQGMPAPAAGAPGAAMPAMAPSPIKVWRYDGVSLPPLDHPRLPKPYQSFDPKDSY